MCVIHVLGIVATGFSYFFRQNLFADGNDHRINPLVSKCTVEHRSQFGFVADCIVRDENATRYQVGEYRL